ncbi:MAG: haloacid dehalogenase type II [Myxococcota bacterium]
MSRTLVFDVNETLLDLSALDAPFAEAFGDPGVKRLWFGQLLRSALVTTILERTLDFAQLGHEALGMVAARRGITLTQEQTQAILNTMRTLPPHPEVPQSLDRLAHAGLRMVALTNSPQEAAEAKLRHAGLIDRFDHVMSVDGVQRFKPAPEVYRMVAERLGVKPAQLRMVAAHDWDIAGAMRVGLAGAFVARPGMVLGIHGPKPDVVGADLSEVASQIIALETA